MQNQPTYQSHGPSQGATIQPLDADNLLALCKASADQLRLDILRVLAKDSFAVQELCQILDYKQSGLSHHLKILSSAGIVTTRREGNTIFYRRANQASQTSLNTLQQALLATVDQLPLSETIQTRLRALQQDRAERSQAFFDEHADQFSHQQEQIAAYEVYGPQTAELVTASVASHSTALEVGPGEGEFLAQLSPHFNSVYALDNSQHMLEKATAFAKESTLNNVHFLHGDTKSSLLKPLNLDCIVVNMVLHHTPSPADIFLDLSALLNTNGQLFITDLCSHDQSWAKEACGDLWLGFDPSDLSEWAANAGLSEGQSVYLTQRNGFRVQISQFIKLKS